MCDECKPLADLIRKTQDIPGSYVTYELTIPGNNNAKLMLDGKELDPSGTEQLPFQEAT